MTESERLIMFDFKNFWTDTDYDNLRCYLFDNADLNYKSFHSSLVQTDNDDYIIGVRMPMLREIGKSISKGNPRSFLDGSYRDYYEERMLRGVVTGLINPENFEDFCAMCDSYIPDIDNWALCDGFCAGLKKVKKFKAEFFDYIEAYLYSENMWAKRTAFVIMLDYYLEDEYIDRVLARCNAIDSDEYYVCMAQAWLLATALAKCESKTMEFLKNNSLNDATFDKAVQKVIESRRVSDKTKFAIMKIKSDRIFKC